MILGTALTIGLGVAALVAVLVMIVMFAGPVMIGPDEIGIVERKWGGKERPDGAIIAMDGENGVQAEMLMTGLKFRPGIFFKVTKYSFVTVGTGSMAYIFARDGKPVTQSQSLGKTMPVESFSDVKAFLEGGGEKGPQRTVLRQGTYIINLAQFAVFTENDTYYHPMGDDDEIEKMQRKIEDHGGYHPVVIKGEEDTCGIVVVHDGPSLPTGTIIAPAVGDDSTDPSTYHNNFQDIDKFLEAGGFRGRQYQVITEGTFWINRLFATVEPIEKTIVPVGYTGVVVSYYGEAGEDVSGTDYRHGELVENGKRGIWKDGLLPGKYAFNTYAGHIEIVPTTNIILKWIAGETGQHNYDSQLAEIEMITKDAFEPKLPLQVVIHIDYQKAPRVIQRFGDINVLVNQSLDPMVSAFFKNVGQTRTVIELIQERGKIQEEAMDKMKASFAAYDLALEEVLIGTPRPQDGDDRIDQILVQLRERQIAEEKETTFAKQTSAAIKERELKEAEAVAAKQADLTNSKIQIEVQQNSGKAELAKAEQDAEKIKVTAAANAEQVRLSAKAEADKIKLEGAAQADAIARKGIAEGMAIQEQVDAYAGRPELKLQSEIVPVIARSLADGQIQLVPRNVIQMGGDGNANVNGADMLVSLIAGQAMGFDFKGGDVPAESTPKEPKSSPEADKIRQELREKATVDLEMSEATELATDSVVEVSESESEQPTTRKPRQKGAGK